MEHIKPQEGVTAKLFVPFSPVMFKASDAESDGTKKNAAARAVDALAIANGEYNGTIFTADELKAMVKLHNDEGSVSKIRICEEHCDTVGALLGRLTSLKTVDNYKAPDGSIFETAVLTDFDLFDKTQIQRDTLTQLEQAPDLIGLSICCGGNLNPVFTEPDDYGYQSISGWQWSDLRLYHIAICTWPACSATEGTIKTAEYKTRDGAKFNPFFFKSSMTSDAMAESKASQTITPTARVSYTNTSSGSSGDPNMFASPQTETNAEPIPQVSGKDYTMETNKIAELAAEVAEIATLGSSIGVKLDTKMIAGFTADQRAAYKADFEKIIEQFNARKTVAAPEPEKGSEFSAGDNQPNYEQLGADLINGTGTFANFGKKTGGN